MFLKKFMLAYGPFYVRVVASSLTLMIIGLTIFYIGYYYIGVVVAFPPQNLLKILPPPYSRYVEHTSLVYQLNLLKDVEEKVTTIAQPSPGYVFLDLTAQPRTDLEIKIYDSSSGRLLYSIIVYESTKINIPLEKSGKYDISIENIDPYTRTCSVMLRISAFSLREKNEVFIAKWLQSIGLVIYGVGFLAFLLSPKIASKYAEAAYMIAPKEIREQLANLSIAQLHRRERSGGE